jgi:hydrogenase 3 maturation protease
VSNPKQSRPSLSQRLRTSLQTADRIAVLAIGSDVRADDAAGLVAGQELQRMLAAASGRNPPVEVFFGGTVPENLTGQIRAFGPSHLILIDAADMGLPPGSVELLETKDILNTASFSTHSLPLSVLSDYLGRMLECQVLLIGIQPRWCKGPARPPESFGRACRFPTEGKASLTPPRGWASFQSFSLGRDSPCRKRLPRRKC